MTDKSDPVDKPALLHREEPTTPDLVELARRIIDAWNARDIEASAGLLTPDTVYDTSPMGGPILEGRAAVRAAVGEFWAMWDEFESEAEEILDLGNGVTLTVSRGRIRDSTGSVQQRAATVGTWTDGLIERGTVYSDIDEARAAAERLAQERG
jgi:ketosteroid isomerase-like protein